jgi:hypothetical protein
MNSVLCRMGISEFHQSTISVQANLRMQVKSQRDGRSQNAHKTNMNQKLNEPSVSVQANLRKQVKPQRDGRSQNRRLMRGLPI